MGALTCTHTPTPGAHPGDPLLGKGHQIPVSLELTVTEVMGQGTLLTAGPHSQGGHRTGHRADLPAHPVPSCVPNAEGAAKGSPTSQDISPTPPESNMQNRAHALS